MKRVRLSARERFNVLTRCNYACFYCGTPATFGVAELQIEHVLPVAQGGTNDPWNLVAACSPCNAGKSAMSPTEATIKAAADLYFAWPSRSQRVRQCNSCHRAWVPAETDDEPMDQCWPCVHAWTDGHTYTKGRP